MRVAQISTKTHNFAQIEKLPHKEGHGRSILVDLSRTCFRMAVGRKLLEILEIGTMGWVKSEWQKTALTLEPVYGVRVHI